MKPEEHERMFRVEDEHFWFVGTRLVIMDMLERELSGTLRDARVLDVGCGTGYTLTCLPKKTQKVGVDASASALAFCASRRTGALLARADACALPFTDGTFDAVLALDVMEHLDRDDAAAEEILRVLKPGGLAIVTVPAFSWLWSAHDEALDHRRRYTLPAIESVLRHAGFSLRFSTYYDTLLLPIVAAVRLSERFLRKAEKPRRDVRELSKPVNALLTEVLAFERHLLRHARLPVGVSCLLACEKPAQGVNP